MKNILERSSPILCQVAALLGSLPAMLLICFYWALFTLVSVYSRAVLLATRSVSQKGACEYVMPIIFFLAGIYQNPVVFCRCRCATKTRATACLDEKESTIEEWIVELRANWEVGQQTSVCDFSGSNTKRIDAQQLIRNHFQRKPRIRYHNYIWLHSDKFKISQNSPLIIDGNTGC